ncbi:hypothetical protein RCL1_001757 [Eukaryota sp. TZLM3-RCL]
MSIFQNLCDSVKVSKLVEFCQVSISTNSHHLNPSITMSTPPAQNNIPNSNKTTSSKKLSRENLNKSSLDSIRSRTLSRLPALCNDLTLRCNTSVYSAIIVHQTSIKDKRKFFIAHSGSTTEEVTVKEFVSTIRNNFETESAIEDNQPKSDFAVDHNVSELANKFNEFDSLLSNFESTCTSKLSECDMRVQNLSNRFSVISSIVKDSKKISSDASTITDELSFSLEPSFPHESEPSNDPLSPPEPVIEIIENEIELQVKNVFAATKLKEITTKKDITASILNAIIQFFCNNNNIHFVPSGVTISLTLGGVSTLSTVYKDFILSGQCVLFLFQTSFFICEFKNNQLKVYQHVGTHPNERVTFTKELDRLNIAEKMTKVKLNTLKSGLEGNWLLLVNILRVIEGDRTETTDAEEQIDLLKKWGFLDVLKTLGVYWIDEDIDSEDDDSRLILSDVVSSHVAPLVSSLKTGNRDDNVDAGIKRTTSISESSFKRKKVNNYFSVRK